MMDKRYPKTQLARSLVEIVLTKVPPRRLQDKGLLTFPLEKAFASELCKLSCARLHTAVAADRQPSVTLLMLKFGDAELQGETSGGILIQAQLKGGSRHTPHGALSERLLISPASSNAPLIAIALTRRPCAGHAKK
jgi:hypothetical protein